MTKKIQREFLANALRAYLEPFPDNMLCPLDAANLSIEFLDGMGLLDRAQIDLQESPKSEADAAVGA